MKSYDPLNNYNQGPAGGFIQPGQTSVAVAGSSAVTYSAGGVPLPQSLPGSPVIASFARALHDHSDAQNGGPLSLDYTEITRLYNPYKFKAYKSADTTVADNTVADVIFDVELYDDNSNYNTTTGEWTCPKAGNYMISAKCLTYAGIGVSGFWYSYISLLKNGAEIENAQLYTYDHATFTFWTGQIVTPYQLALGDVLKLQAYGDTNDASNWKIGSLKPNTNFSVFYVSD